MNPLVGWAEDYRSKTDGSGSLVFGQFLGAGLGDGGRSTWMEWFFDNVLEGDLYLASELSGTLFQHLGTGSTSIEFDAKGSLVPFQSGTYPTVTWLEAYREKTDGSGTLALGVLQERGLGDGGRQLWSEWIFGRPTISGDCNISVDATSAPLRLGLGTGTSEFFLRPTGNLLSFLGTVFNPYDKHAQLILGNDYLTISSSQLPRLVRGTVYRNKGKYYFECKEVTYPTSYDKTGGIGIANSLAPLNASSTHSRFKSWDNGQGVPYLTDGSSTIFSANLYYGNNYCVAIDIDAGKIWIGNFDTTYQKWWSIRDGVVYEDGNPETGENPTYSTLPGGHLYPVGVGSVVDVIFNFGGSAFVKTPPEGFNPWDTPHPIWLGGETQISLEASGLIVAETVPIVGQIDIGFALSGALSTLISGETTISIVLEDAVLSSTLPNLSSETLEIKFELSGDLRPRPVITIAGTLTFDLTGDLIGTKNMYGTVSFGFSLEGVLSSKLNFLRSHSSPYAVTVVRAHRSFYACDIQYNTQISGWGVMGMRNHQAPYEVILAGSITSSQRTHFSPYEVLTAASVSAFRSHFSPYEVLTAASVSAFRTHLSPYEVTGALSGAFRTHLSPYEVLLLSSASVAYRLHESAYGTSGALTSAYRLHESLYEVTGALTGGSRAHFSPYEVILLSSASVAYRLHDSAYGVSGALSGASRVHVSPYEVALLSGVSTAFRTHVSPYQVTVLVWRSHVASWKTVVTDQRLHRSSYTVLPTVNYEFRLHKSRYRVIDTTPTLITGLIYVEV